MIDYEHAVIGALLKDSSVISDVDLSPDDFAIESYRATYQMIIDMFAASSVIDVLTVSDALQRSNPMDRSYWLAFCGRAVKDCASTANVSAYAELVKSDSKIRSVKTIAAELLNEVESSKDVANTVDSAVSRLMELSVTRKNYEYSISQSMYAAIEMIEEASESKGTVGVKTGLIELDKILSGFHDSDLYIVAARPAMGKTAALLNFVDNSGVSIGLISSEQPHEQIGLRMIAINGNVNAHKMRIGGLDDYGYKKVTVASARLKENNNIWINDRSGISIVEVIRQARKWKHKHKIKALYVDYVQRIKWTDQKMARWEQVGNVVMALKELARELQIPVIALAQVNRNVEQRDNKRPHMGDIANSSEIEKEADCIMTLYRDEVYDQDTKDVGIMEIDVLKNRHGPTGFKRFYWDAKSMKIRDLDAHQYVENE